MAQKPPAENRRSVLLSTEDNQTVFRLLGTGCQSQSTTVIELYETTPPIHRIWSRRAVGVLCFVKDNTRKNYFFRLYCIINKKMIWEQEMYNNLEYVSPTSFMHSFEGDDCIIAFNFSNEDEAKHMKDMVLNRLAAKARRHERRQRELQARKNNHTETPSKIGAALPLTMTSTNRRTVRKGITKADIGVPQDFKHVGHIGWNRDTGMECRTDDTALSELFSKAGISENQMKDRATRHFIYDFISKHDKNQIIKDEKVVEARRAPPAIPSGQPSSLTAAPPPPPSATTAPAGPPVPPRSGSKPTPNRAAPPPPPSVTHASHEHNNHHNATANSVRSNVPPPRPPPTGPRSSGTKAAIPPPPPANAPAPPPPPSMPTPAAPMSPPPPPMAPLHAVDNSQPDGRSALLESIRSGMTLKPVGHTANEQPERPRGDDARGDLLSEIRKGFQLKPCNEREVKPISPAADSQHNGVNDLAAALSRALAERNRVIHPDDDDDDESSDSNDDWDD